MKWPRARWCGTAWKERRVMFRWVFTGLGLAGALLAGEGHLQLQAARLPEAVRPVLTAQPAHLQQASVAAAARTAAQPPRALLDQSRALLDQYCVTCHNTKLKTAGLMLDTANMQQVGAGADMWEKV